MRILLWHVHGSWTTSFVQGDHDYFLPVLPRRGPYGRGRAQTWTWPETVQEVDRGSSRSLDVDVVVLQRPEEVYLARRWLGRSPGRDLPAVYVEHDTPAAAAATTRHPLAGQSRITVAHVTHFNAVMWDNGAAPVRVVEHGIVDPGHQWSGDLPHAAVVVNEPVRRGRVVGADLVTAFAGAGPLDVFGMQVDALTNRLRGAGVTANPYVDLPQHLLHEQLARRRAYLHPYRWTSLGLSLLEAMALGMPVVAYGSTEAWEAVPPGAGWVSTDPERLSTALRALLLDPELAAVTGRHARAAVLRRYGLARFLDDWDRLLKEVTDR